MNRSLARESVNQSKSSSIKSLVSNLLQRKGVIHAPNSSESETHECESAIALERLDNLLSRLPNTTLEILAVEPPAFTLAGEYDGQAYALFLRAADAIHERVQRMGFNL